MEFPGQSDANIWKLFKEGDENAFTTIYARYSKNLYYYGLKFTRNHSIIEDSLQDLFFELARNRKSIGQTDNILRYLLTSFRHKLIRKLKSEYRYDLKNSSEEFDFEVMYSIEHDMVLEDKSNYRNMLFVHALKELSPRQNEAIYLKFNSGLTYEEISDILEMSVESCRNLICRAIRSLKEKIHVGGHYSDQESCS